MAFLQPQGAGLMSPGGPMGPYGGSEGMGFNPAVAQPQRSDAEEVQQARFRAQFRKTEMCRYYRSGCRNGDVCQYAHGEYELQCRPNLTKTSLCQLWAQSSCPVSAEECRFAHGAADLRVTPQYEKTALCRAFVHGRCKLGASCRFSHSASEINQDLGADDFSGAYGQFGQEPSGFRGDQGMMQPPWPGPDMLGGSLWPGQQAFAWGGFPEGGRDGQTYQPFMMPPDAVAIPYMQMPGVGSLPGGSSPTSAWDSGFGGMQMPGTMMFPPQAATQPAMQSATQPVADAAKKQDVQLTVRCAQGGTMKFKIKTTMALRKLMDTFCSRKGLESSRVRFSVGGAEIQEEDTANKLGLSDDSVITADILKDVLKDAG